MERQGSFEACATRRESVGFFARPRRSYLSAMCIEGVAPMKLFCRHDSVEIFRAHRETSVAKDNAKNLAWVDIHKVHNFFRCAKCKKFLKPAKSLVFGGDSHE